MRKLIKSFVTGGVLVILIAGGFFAWQKGLLSKIPFLNVSNNETADWQIYKNEVYGFEFKYPQGWLFAAQPTGGTYDILDIHLSNFQHSDSPACDQNFMGLEIQVGHPKDQNHDFSSFVESQIVESGLGPSGSLEEIKIDNHLGFKVQYSGWDSGCGGPGYFIEQDKNHYTYIFTGTHKDNREKGLQIFNQILSTFKFINSTITSTEVIKYVPTEIPSEIKEGSCWINALTSGRKGTWRCVVENRIYDPCFVISKINNLICDSDPITGGRGFQLKLTEPLPEDTGAEEGQGWLIELEDRITCRFITGATGVINEKRINYMCGDSSWILGDLQTGTVWKAERVEVDDSLRAKSIEFVRIRRVWR